MSEAICTLYRIDFQFGSEVDRIQCEQCSRKSNRTGPVLLVELFTLYQINILRIFVLVWQKKPGLESKRIITRFRSKNGADPLNSQFTLGTKRSKKAIRYETYHFWNWSVPGHNRHKHRAEPVGSRLNRSSIQYGFRGALLIDPVQCEHGLKSFSIDVRFQHVMRLPVFHSSVTALLFFFNCCISRKNCSRST